MAVLQEYHKVRETDYEVEYEYGFPVKDRLMVIRKTDPCFTVVGGRDDHATWAVFYGILRRLRAQREWPTGGAVQH